MGLRNSAWSEASSARVMSQPYSSMKFWALRNRTRRLYPPATLLGSAPSTMANSSVLLWSRSEKAASIGAICSSSPSPERPSFLAMASLAATGSCTSVTSSEPARE